ncbi:hypothetical protein [Pseudomonas sp. GTC 16482]|uniref:hypothetical protein n=1 Tax=Pseudomonas sp. GTC 16482 TaxID=1661693 RepID=UPI000AD429DD|nr:hypothetical protein [Pseudomonas sp. GTC 16482]
MNDTQSLEVQLGMQDLQERMRSLAKSIKVSNKIREQRYPTLRPHLEYLSIQSWFISLYLGFADYERLLFCGPEAPQGEAEKKAYIDQLFQECYRGYFDRLVCQIIEDYPTREFAIAPAAEAHRRQDYALSVPVFISQAEGVIRDHLKAELFWKTQKNKWENVSDVAHREFAQISQLESWFDYADASHWIQLMSDLPVAYGDDKRHRLGYQGFNRNTILHGLDLCYANECYSLKAFSLLCHAAGLKDIQKVDE